MNLPTSGLTAFCGVSGSGKSSFVFDTVHAEGQRRYLEALGIASVFSAPKALLIEGVPPTLALRQNARPSSRSTIATLTDLSTMMAIIASTCGTAHCPQCDRPVIVKTVDEIVAKIMEVEDGSKLTLEADLSPTEGVLNEVKRAGFSRVRADDQICRIEDLKVVPKKLRVVVDRIKKKASSAGRLHDSCRTALLAGKGCLVVVNGREETSLQTMSRCYDCELDLPELKPRNLQRFSAGGCPTCSGGGCEECENTGFSAFSRSVSFAEDTYVQAMQRPLSWWLGVSLPKRPGLKSLTVELHRRIVEMQRLGLGELAANRVCTTLSAGQWQRVRLARVLVCAVAGVLVLLDEPASGLDNNGVGLVQQAIARIIERGNAVWVISHKPQLLQDAQRIIEFGPSSGKEGGEVVFDGSFTELEHSQTKTAAHLQSAPVHKVTQKSVGTSLSRYTAIVGESGSGKTTTLRTLQERADQFGLDNVIFVGGQAAGSLRSCPATYVGVWSVMRSLFAATTAAKVAGIHASMFSLSKKGGRCEACKGLGFREVDLGPLPNTTTICQTCSGRRFHKDVLNIHWRGRNAFEWLQSPISEARTILGGHPKLMRMLTALVHCGLGYVFCGQATSTLSGGEARRLHLARELVRMYGKEQRTLVLMDQPEIGLHRWDMKRLVSQMQAWTDKGATIVVATNEPIFQAPAEETILLAHRWG